MDPLLNNAPCGFVTFGDDGTMLDVNATLASQLGYKPVELRGWHLQKILPPGSRVFYQTHVFPLLRMHGVVEEIYIALRSSDGTNLPMLMNAVRRDEDGTTVNDCVLMRMTRRHEFEDELLAARRLAEQANASKARFLSMMSHDLRTPLTALTGYTALLLASVHGDLNEEQRRALSRMQRASGELTRMIDDILNFAQIESGKVPLVLQNIPATSAIERAVSLVRLQAENAGISLVPGVCEDDAVVLADPERLQQILLNLLTNAVKFTQEGGQVAIDGSRSDAHVRISVRDNGPGIDPSQMERIFEPFEQLENRPGDAALHGVGLGLAISRELARAMGGEVTATSKQGAGSVFTVELPAASA